MEAFLRQVCRYFISDDSFSGKCFVFPNRRSMTFFRKYISDFQREFGERPVLSPVTVTIEDLFIRIHDSVPLDRVSRMLVLYDCYRELNPKAEPLDEFIFWGDIILSDFDDVDKCHADPLQLFRNVSELKDMDGGLGDLSKTQYEALMRFIGHFSPDRVKLTSRLDGKMNPKESFLMIWNMLYPLYVSFGSKLSSAGHSYPGMVYREVADRCAKNDVRQILKDVFPRSDCFVFVGLNALNSCERMLLACMRDAGIARFCWDFSTGIIRDEINKSSFFMKDNIRDFPQEFLPDPEGLPDFPEMNVLSVPSSVGQVKHLKDMISGRNPEDCAVILPDESLLLPLLNSIPPEVEDINVTMGYPMSSSRFYSLVTGLLTLQVHARRRDSSAMFYHKQVRDILSNGIVSRLSSMDEEISSTVVKVREEAKYYVPSDSFVESRVLKTLFSPLDLDMKSSDSGQIHRIEDYLLNVISVLGACMSAFPELVLELDFARRVHECVTILRAKDIPVTPQAYVRLLSRMCQLESVPFHGEPLRGLQVMGPLETRALDFKTVVVFSANEGVFPRRNTNSSFIPPLLRKAFGLTTYEHQDAVWAYYFYRLISRAETVWLVYDSRTEGLKSGEESRYIKQLKYHFHVPMRHFVSMAEVSMIRDEGLSIPKTGDMVEKIRNMRLSASSFQKYISCPAQFYYSMVLGLKPEDEVAESLDGAMTGNVFHNVMQDLYGVSDHITLSYLASCRKDEKAIRDRVRNAIMAEMGGDDVGGRDLVSENVLVKLVLKVLDRDMEFLKGNSKDSFHILGLEKDFEVVIHGFRFYGRIDRLDSFDDGKVRIVDYKSGKDRSDILDVPDGKEKEVVRTLFDAKARNHYESKAGFQFYIYDRMACSELGCPVEAVSNTMYSAVEIFRDEIRTSDANPSFLREMDERLSLELDTLSDVSVPFECRKDENVCKYCDFRMICGK